LAGAGRKQTKNNSNTLAILTSEHPTFNLDPRSDMSRIRRWATSIARPIPVWFGGSSRGLKAGWIAAALALGAFAGGPACAWGNEADTNAAPASVNETNNQETLRAYLELQEQLHLTQLAIEQNRKEARETSAQNSEILAGRLQTI
jgi:hypothetical protein